MLDSHYGKQYKFTDPGSGYEILDALYESALVGHFVERKAVHKETYILNKNYAPKEHAQN